MNFRPCILILLSLLLTLTGCASQKKMAFCDGAEPIAATERPVCLLTATLKNTYNTSHQPKMLSVHVEKVTGDKTEPMNFTLDDKAKNESDDVASGSSYLLRLQLEQGDYILRGLSSMSSSFPIHGFFFTPLHEKFTVGKPGVFYLGHIDATVRERKENEFKAGGTLPLIDQAISGGSSGTFDIAVTDQWQEDESLFRSTFPQLATAEITPAILPPFDRAYAQKWWEDH